MIKTNKHFKLNVQCRRSPRFSGLFSVHCPEWCNWPSRLHHCYSGASPEPLSTSGNFCFWSERVLRKNSLMGKVHNPGNQFVLPYDGPNIYIKKELYIKYLNYIHKHVRKQKTPLTCNCTGFSDQSRVSNEKWAVPSMSVIRVTLTLLSA